MGNVYHFKAEVWYMIINSDNIDNSPPPNEYNLKSEFNPHATSRAFSFGIAREAYSKVYIKENPLRDPCIPGPGTYGMPNIVGNETSKKYSMRPRTTS